MTIDNWTAQHKQRAEKLAIERWHLLQAVYQITEARKDGVADVLEAVDAAAALLKQPVFRATNNRKPPPGA